MYIVHIASELAPVAKVGGLGDVTLGLCRELSRKMHDVDLIIPKYDCLDSDTIRDFAIDTPELLTYYEGNWFSNTVWVGWVDNLKVYFIEPHHPSYFFNRSCFYGCDDDIDRYAYFSRAALEFLSQRQPQPDIIHLHDWQTAAAAPLYKQIFSKQGFDNAKIVFTIHNIEYQGKCAPFNLDRIGLDGKEMLDPTKMQDSYSPDTINLLKGAIVYSDFVTTVSPNYASEVLTPIGGRGLDPVLRKYKDKFCGILNGIDYSYWNPETDRYLPAHFSSREIPANKQDRNTIDKKALVKKILREKLDLDQSHCPIVGCVTRLVPQKGLDLIKHTVEYTLKNGGQFVLLGSTPIPSINAEFHALQKKYAENGKVHFTLHSDEGQAHTIFAASDMFIVPSLFEPCGLTQMISLKYGSIPIVRKTGGLADTIVDVDYSNRPAEETNGYVFDHPDKSGIDSALNRAFDCWFHNPGRWRQLVVHGMNTDFSWTKPTEQYLEVYTKLRG